MPHSKHSHIAFAMPDRILGIERFSLFSGLNPSVFWAGLCLVTKIRHQPVMADLCVPAGPVRKVAGLRVACERYSTRCQPGQLAAGIVVWPEWPLPCISLGCSLSWTRGVIVNAQGQRKCAYSECKCVVASAETYCSDYCSDAADVQETEIQCDCKHAPCLLG